MARRLQHRVGQDERSLFQCSLDPMLVCDDRRRLVDANAAVCLLLRMSREAILDHALDDLLPAHLRSDLDGRWRGFLSGGGSPRLSVPPVAIALAGGEPVTAGLSVATLGPGRHLVLVDFPPVRALTEHVQQADQQTGSVLTKREREVLTLVAQGKTGVDIARQLVLSPATVESHVNNALLKLQARNRAHGIATAVFNREIDVADLEDVPSGSPSPTGH